MKSKIFLFFLFLSSVTLQTYSQKNNESSEILFDVASIVNIHSSEDVIKKRETVVNWLWGDTGFPFEKLPGKIRKEISDGDFESLGNLKSIDKLEVNMDFGINSFIYHFIPKNSNGSATVYHQGHGGKFSKGINTINAFLEKGYDVFALSMPLLGHNNKPVVDIQGFGKMQLHSHNQLMYLQPEKGHPIQYFMEAIAQTVNYAQKYNFKEIVMIGLSGGGWATTLYSAIDPRIKISFPVAGSLPIYLRFTEIGKYSSVGDYEQQDSDLYRIANFLELYIMGAHGKKRKQLQILNEFDTCCFSGTGYKTYEDFIKAKMVLLGTGNFDVFLDSSHKKHQISPKALEVIFEYLQND